MIAVEKITRYFFYCIRSVQELVPVDDGEAAELVTRED